MEIRTVILASFAFLGFFLFSVFMLNKDGITLSNRLLSILILIVALILADLVLLTSGSYQYIPHLSGVTFPLHFLFGPLFYFYIRSHLQVPLKFKKVEILHFTPFLLAIYLRSDFYLLPADSKIIFMENLLNPNAEQGTFSWYRFSIITCKIFFNAFYIFYSVKLINKFQREGKDFKWLKTISLFFLTFWGLYFLSFIQISIFRVRSIDFDIIIASFLAVYIFSIGIYSFLKKDQLTGILALQTLKKQSLSHKYRENRGTFLNKLEYLMNDEKVFLDPDLSLEKLSKISRIPRHQLSLLINREYSYNYNDFINRYRVKNAEKMLINGAGKRFSLFGIGIESGFKSKNSFIRAFKKFTSLTPSEYLDNSLNKAKK